MIGFDISCTPLLGVVADASLRVLPRSSALREFGSWPECTFTATESRLKRLDLPHASKDWPRCLVRATGFAAGSRNSISAGLKNSLLCGRVTRPLGVQVGR